jgi:membrane fusion protein
MGDPLFRKEAVDYRQQRLYGEIILATPLSTKILAVLVGAIVLSIFLLLILGSYSRRETLQGWLTPDTGLARIVPPESGVIGDLFVHEDEAVAAGSPLFTINIASDVGTASTIATRVLDQLAVEQRDLEQQLTAIGQTSKVRQREASERIVRLHQQADQVRHEEDLQQERTTFAEQQLKQIRALAEKGFIPMTDYNKRQDELWSRNQEIEELKRRRLEIENELGRLQQEVQTLPYQLTEDSSVIKEHLANLETRRALAERSRQITIRAPLSGTVATMTARLGKFVSPAREEMVLLPSGGKLQAILYAPTKAAGFLEQGQEVRLRFDAFPFQKYGSAIGRIVNVSHTILSATEAEIPLPDSSPVYRVTVSIPDSTFHSWGKSFPLQAGMTIKADAILERRGLWELFFEPVIIALHR